MSVEVNSAVGNAAGVVAGNACLKTLLDGGTPLVNAQTLAIEQASPLGQLDLLGSAWPSAQQSCDVVKPEVLCSQGAKVVASSHAPTKAGRPAMTSESMNTNARANITSV